VQEHFEAFAEKHRLPRYLRHAARAWALCKTAALGAHVRRCPNGHVEGIWYNSCRHRSCPQCSALEAERWLNGRMRSVLPCPHYHLVFTLPSGLNEVWRYNRKLLTELLFRSVRWSLFRMLGDERYLDATPGILAVLHTWGRTLCFHPHLHCLVTGGGLDAENLWRDPKRSILIPCRPLGEIFRGYFLRRLERLARRNQLRLPPDRCVDDVLLLLQRVAKKKWTPRVQERYSHGSGVIRYLARYVRGGPFRNHSLIACDGGKVTFRYKNWRERDDSGRPSPDVLTLSIDDFLARLLSHVPMPYLRTVRGWGLYAHTTAQRRELARQQLPEPSDSQQATVPTPRKHSLRCTVCGARLLVQLLSRSPRPNAHPPPTVTEAIS
jgi:Putative transposase/Transposase zinc-binding domain